MAKTTDTKAAVVEVKRGRKPDPKSLRARMIARLTKKTANEKAKKSGRWVDLQSIYNMFHANDIVQQAEIRGILNRAAVDPKGEFQRNPKVRGLYRVNSKVA